MSVVRHARASTAVMGAATAVAIVVLLLEGRNQWFFHDDWGQWYAPTARQGPRIDDATGFFFDAHNGHWMTLNRVVFEVVFRAVGLRSYLAYLVPVMVVHLGAAWLLRALCRNAGVDVWLATAAGCIFVWFGAGAEVFVWADAFGFAAPVVLMGVQLLLTDHDGPIDRRDVGGAVLAVLGMMAGAAALTMLGVVVLSLALRARWNALALAVAPAVLTWSAWWLWTGHSDSQDFVDRDHLAGLANYVRSGVDNSIEGVTRLGVAGVVLVALAVFAARLGQRLRAPGVAPIAAMAAGALAWFTLLAFTRINASSDLAGSSRYLYVGGFLLLPMVVLGADHVVRIDRRLFPVALALLAWSATQNLFAIDAFGRPWGQRKQAIERAVATVITLPGVESLPPGTRIEDPQERFLPVWVAPVDVLLALRDHGDLPDFPPPTELERLEWGSMLLVTEAPLPDTSGLVCRPDAGSIAVDVPLVVVLRSPRAGMLGVQLDSHTTQDAGPRREFALPADRAVAITIGLGGVDATLDAPPGTDVCTAAA
jgi:hypothetical protein